MYYAIERLAAERVADLRREADRAGTGGPHRMPPLVRALLRGLCGGTAVLRGLRGGTAVLRGLRGGTTAPRAARPGRPRLARP